MARRDPVAAVLNAVRLISSDVEVSARLVPRNGQRVEASAPLDHDSLYDALVTDIELRSATRKLFSGGHYAEAIEKACKLVNNTVKKRCGSTKDGPDLMNHAFGTAAPMLRINPGKTESDRDEQDGYRFLFAGLMTGLRNPRAHELINDEPDAALEVLVMANHLMRVLGRAKRTRRRAVNAN